MLENDNVQASLKKNKESRVKKQFTLPFFQSTQYLQSKISIISILQISNNICYIWHITQKKIQSMTYWFCLN